MALKPIGSEKLEGQDKINRIMEIARYGEVTKNDDYHTSTNSFSQKAADGNIYAIIQEKDGYYLKCGINESELDYVSGGMNKKKDRFNSYSKALKRMNLIFKPLNEEYNEGTGMSMYDESEMDEQEKFVLNVPDEGGDEESVDVDMDLDMGDEDEDLDMDMDDEEEDLDVDLEGGDEEEMEGFMKPIQKLTGKLGQKLRDVEEELGSADIKYVLNSIISAVDLDNLDEDDKDDVLDRFDEDEAAYGDEEDVDVDIDMGDEDMDLDTEVGDEDSMDLDMDDEEVAMESLKERVGNLLESYIETGKKTKSSPNTAEQYLKSKIKHLQETKKLKKKYKTVEQELSCEKFLKENKSFKFKRKTDSGKIILESKNKKVWILTNGFIK